MVSGPSHRQAYLKHPYYRYGYSAVLLMGIIGVAIAWSEDTPGFHHGNEERAQASKK